MDGIDLLVRQHRSLEALLQQGVDESDPARRAALFRRAADDLTVHLASEEEIFYPAVNARRTEDTLLESLEEHLSLKRLMADLLELSPEEPTYEAKFKVLTEQAVHHHKEEEEHLFPKVRQLLGEEQLGRLGGEMEALQQRLRAEGAPREDVVNQTDAAAPLK
ncbi:hemerythrin domain-containing protein [Caldimonas tepidiphila]|uniref:hemerythrin domain-containing protein n=1 Tax=Caldimonas tepidiphila TaxID=2315841 RepID=UPI000E5B953A|nr:hemerythrin domain-containing protein [Caldimonas tepidiphila]